MSNHRKKASIACLLITFFLLAFSSQLAQAATSQCTVYSGSNTSSQNNSTWASTVKSSLTQTGSNELMRLQADALPDAYLVEYYDLEYNLTKTVNVAKELPLYGGFYSDGTNYYVLSGQSNTEEDGSKEVFRLTKYSASWERLASASLYGANTYSPFAAGSARMDHEGSILFVRTCHTMYAASDGRHHQANVTIQFNTDTMSVLDSYTGVASTSRGYVSHSFNQFIKLDNGRIVGVDHGDAYPRSVVLFKSKSDYTETGYTKSFSNATMLAISGSSGANATGVSVGGFEISSDHYLVAGNSVEMGESYSATGIRNIFVTSVDRDLSEDPVIHWITSYGPEESSPKVPHLVKISNTRFLLLWTKDGVLNYCTINNNGQMTGSIHTMNADLSDCDPVIIDQKVVWYTWKNGDVTFYEISIDDLAATNTIAIHNGHKFECTAAATGTNIASRKCTGCGLVEEFTTMTRFVPIWWDDNEKASTIITAQPIIGSTYHVTRGSCEPVDAENKELEIISSDESVASVDDQYFTFLKHGVATITVRAKYNPEANIQKTFVVSHGIASKKTTKASTCSETGIKEYVCSCGETINESLPINSTNHAYATRLENAADPTCVSPGYTGDTYCSGCNQMLSSGTAVSATGKHTYGDWVVTITPTCSATGKKIHTCKVCGITKYTLLEKDSANHSGDQVVRNFKEATCGAAGYSGETCCSDCDAVLKKGKAIPATGLHTWDQGKVTTIATCASKGIMTHTCSTCSKTKKEDIAIDPENHTGSMVRKNASGATCLQQGYTGDVCCKDCGVLLSKGTAIPKLKPTIKLSPTSKTIKKGKSFTLVISGLAKGDSILSVKTSKSSVATVKKAKTAQYKISARAKGKATITVKLKSGKTAACKVTVK